MGDGVLGENAQDGRLVTDGDGRLWEAEGCCGEMCDVFSDSFTRGDDDDPGTDWTEVSGDADIVSNQLRVFDGCVVVCDTAASQVEMRVTCDWVSPATNETVCVIIGYVDSSNYFYGKFTQGLFSGTIAIWENSSGTHTRGPRRVRSRGTHSERGQRADCACPVRSDWWGRRKMR